MSDSAPASGDRTEGKDDTAADAGAAPAAGGAGGAGEAEATGSQATASSPVRRAAVVAGATGAIGRELVGTLLRSGNWHPVTVLVRRPSGNRVLPEDPGDLNATDLIAEGRLVEHVVAYDELDAAAAAAAGAGFVPGEPAAPFAVERPATATFFCCLGTTRKDAGSAAAFRRVDFDYVRAVHGHARAAGIAHASVVSSQGANPKSWFLYPEVKGKAEEMVKAMGFDKVSIWRPGMLERGAAARGIEKFINFFSAGTPTSVVAEAMRREAEEGGAGVNTYDDATIRRRGAAASAL